MALTFRATHVLQWFVQREAKSRDGADLRKPLVIANQNVAVNTFPGLVHTARHTMGVNCTRSS